VTDLKCKDINISSGVSRVSLFSNFQVTDGRQHNSKEQDDWAGADIFQL